MSALVVAEVVWVAPEPAPRAAVLAAVTMRKALVGWWVSVRVGCVVATTWHITFDGASSRYDLGELHTAGAMAAQAAGASGPHHTESLTDHKTGEPTRENAR